MTISKLELDILSALWRSYPKPMDSGEIFGECWRGNSVSSVAHAISLLERDKMLCGSYDAPNFTSRLTVRGIAKLISLIGGGWVVDEIAVVEGDCEAGVASAKVATPAPCQVCGEPSVTECPCGKPTCESHAYDEEGHKSKDGLCADCSQQAILEGYLSTAESEFYANLGNPLKGLD